MFQARAAAPVAAANPVENAKFSFRAFWNKSREGNIFTRFYQRCKSELTGENSVVSLVQKYVSKSVVKKASVVCGAVGGVVGLVAGGVFGGPGGAFLAGGLCTVMGLATPSGLVVAGACGYAALKVAKISIETAADLVATTAHGIFKAGKWMMKTREEREAEDQIVIKREAELKAQKEEEKRKEVEAKLPPVDVKLNAQKTARKFMTQLNISDRYDHLSNEDKISLMKTIASISQRMAVEHEGFSGKAEVIKRRIAESLVGQARRLPPSLFSRGRMDIEEIFSLSEKFSTLFAKQADRRIRLKDTNYDEVMSGVEEIKADKPNTHGIGLIRSPRDKTTLHALHPTRTR